MSTVVALPTSSKCDNLKCISRLVPISDNSDSDDDSSESHEQTSTTRSTTTSIQRTTTTDRSSEEDSSEERTRSVTTSITIISSTTDDNSDSSEERSSTTTQSTTSTTITSTSTTDDTSSESGEKIIPPKNAICGNPKCDSEESARFLWPGRTPRQFYRCVKAGENIWAAQLNQCEDSLMSHFSYSKQACVRANYWKNECRKA